MELTQTVQKWIPLFLLLVIVAQCSENKLKKDECHVTADRFPYGVFVVPSVEGTVVKTGDVVKLSCKEEFYEETVISVCAGNNQFQNRGPGCRKVSCQLDQVPDHILYSPRQKNWNVNEVVNFSCKDGYVYEDIQTICQRTGLWSSKQGRCKRKHCSEIDVAIKNGRVNRCKPCPYMKRITVTCDPGFRYVGDELECDENGNWKGEIGSCTRVKCGAVHQREIGELYTHWNSDYEQETILICPDGYKLVGPQISTCQSNGKWLHLGECKGVECGAIHKRETGKLYTRWTSDYEQETILICPDGYKLDGPQISTCNANQQWSQLGECKEDKREVWFLLLFLLVIPIGLIYYKWNQHKSSMSPEQETESMPLDTSNESSTHL